jgi:hypothetical protein
MLQIVKSGQSQETQPAGRLVRVIAAARSTCAAIFHRCHKTWIGVAAISFRDHPLTEDEIAAT